MRSGPPVPLSAARADAAVTQPALRPMASMTTTWMGSPLTSQQTSATLAAMYRAALP